MKTKTKKDLSPTRLAYVVITMWFYRYALKRTRVPAWSITPSSQIANVTSATKKKPEDQLELWWLRFWKIQQVNKINCASKASKTATVIVHFNTVNGTHSTPFENKLTGTKLIRTITKPPQASQIDIPTNHIAIFNISSTRAFLLIVLGYFKSPSTIFLI